MKTKKIPIIAIIIIVVLIISVGLILFAKHQAQSQKKNADFLNIDTSKINKIYITNGNNGEILSVVDKLIIADISTYLTKLKLTKISPPPSSGWSYRFSIIENNKEVLNITFNGDEYCTIHDSKYKIDKSTNITVDTLYNEAKKVSK
jgi:preprotein translocase subunit YajC